MKKYNLHDCRDHFAMQSTFLSKTYHCYKNKSQAPQVASSESLRHSASILSRRPEPSASQSQRDPSRLLLPAAMTSCVKALTQPSLVTRHVDVPSPPCLSHSDNAWLKSRAHLIRAIVLTPDPALSKSSLRSIPDALSQPNDKQATPQPLYRASTGWASQ